MPKLKILLIDDEKMLIELYQQRFLAEKKYEFLTVNDTKQGFETAKQEQPDLILLDLVFPKEEYPLYTITEDNIKVNAHAGFLLLKKLKKDPKTKDIPIIVLTNLPDQYDDEKMAKKLGADEYILKSRVVPKDVVERVDKMLRKK